MLPGQVMAAMQVEPVQESSAEIGCLRHGVAVAGAVRVAPEVDLYALERRAGNLEAWRLQVALQRRQRRTRRAGIDPIKDDGQLEPRIEGGGIATQHQR